MKKMQNRGISKYRQIEDAYYGIEKSGAKVGGFMIKKISIGYQEFDDIIKKQLFYIDKTAFIKEWWDSGDRVTLITRPRRFGKTLTMSMVNHFFLWSIQKMLRYLMDLIFGRMSTIGRFRDNFR